MVNVGDVINEEIVVLETCSSTIETNSVNKFYHRNKYIEIHYIQHLTVFDLVI